MALEDGFFKRLRRGELGLARTFWLYIVLVSVCMGLVQALLDVVAPDMSVFYALFMMVFGTVYHIFCLIGLWRASARYGGPAIWAILGRLYVVFSAVVLAALIFFMLAALAGA